MLEQPAVRTLEKIANIFVSQGKYRTQSDALRAIALDHVDRKIALYQGRVKRFEKKYRVSTDGKNKRSPRLLTNDFAEHWRVFHKFTERLKNRATIPQEDDWMDWEAALEMVEGWQKLKRTLES